MKNLTEAEWIRQQAQPIEEKKIDAPEGISLFVDLAKKVKDGKAFMDKARKIRGIPFEVSSWFFDKYSGGNRTMLNASTNFVADVAAGKYD